MIACAAQKFENQSEALWSVGPNGLATDIETVGSDTSSREYLRIGNGLATDIETVGSDTSSWEYLRTFGWK